LATGFNPSDAMTTLTRFVFTAALAISTASAQATLVNRGGGMVYDTELNITWLQDWNLAKTTGYTAPGAGADGRMTWGAAQQWAADLVHGGYDDWRLPTMVDTGTPGCNNSNAGGTDCGFNVQTKVGSTVYSEFAHLWYDTLGNLSRCAPGDEPCRSGQPNSGLRNTGPFLQADGAAYWLGVRDASLNFLSWFFVTGIGLQSTGFNLNQLQAMAVRDGDVTRVPEPGTLPLTLLGVCMAVLAGANRARRTVTETGSD
jgi:hypothetical protein